MIGVLTFRHLLGVCLNLSVAIKRECQREEERFEFPVLLWNETLLSHKSVCGYLYGYTAQMCEVCLLPFHIYIYGHKKLHQKHIFAQLPKFATNKAFSCACVLYHFYHENSLRLTYYSHGSVALCWNRARGRAAPPGDLRLSAQVEQA